MLPILILFLDVDAGEVWESDLPDGSGGGSTTDSGHFVIDTGNDTLKLLEVQDVNGDWVAIAADNTVVQGKYGELNVDMDGSWEYEIFENTLDHPDFIFTDGDGDRDQADQVFDQFATRVTDSDDDSTFEDGVQSSEVLTIAVNDDTDLKQLMILPAHSCKTQLLLIMSWAMTCPVLMM